MANINIKFNGKDYLLSCDDGQEENLKELASDLDSRFQILKNELGNIGENKLHLITSAICEFNFTVSNVICYAAHVTPYP